MAQDGCQRVDWYSSGGFPWLLHQPSSASESYAQQQPAAAQARQPSSGAQTAALPRAKTGVWDGPAPLGSLQMTEGAAADAPGPVLAKQPESLLLPGGTRMPLLGFGTYKIETADVIREALDAGYTHFDCASMYGNEAVIGEALQAACRQRRSSLFITSKAWNDCHRPAALRQSCEKSLKDLQCGYLDLYLMHWPDAWVPGSGTPGKPDDEVTILETWRAMEQLVADGLVRSLGVSNFSLAQVEALLAAASVKPVVNQIELHPLLAQRKLVGTCLRKGVHSVAYSPLGHARPDVLTHPAVQRVAQQLGRTPAQVVLRWNMQRGVAVLPRSQSPVNIRANLEGAFDWELPRQAKAQLDSLDSGLRTADNDWHDWGTVEEGGAAKPSLAY